MKDLFGGISAGILIGIGGTVYLSCDSKYIGAVFFSVALICICSMGYSLYTGKVGFMADSHTKKDFANLLFCFIGNLIGTVLSGIAIMYTLPAVSEKAAAICDAKLLQSVPNAFIRAIFCGILMYLAVAVYKNKSSYIGILFCVPVFILSGFEHSVANMYYFSVGAKAGIDTVLYILLIVAGNSVGGLLLPILSKCAAIKGKD